MSSSPFANATVFVGAADWQHFVEGGDGGSRNAAIMYAGEEHIELVDRNGVTLLPDMTTQMTPGHTPGHMSTVVSSGKERLMLFVRGEPPMHSAGEPIPATTER